MTEAMNVNAENGTEHRVKIVFFAIGFNNGSLIPILGSILANVGLGSYDIDDLSIDLKTRINLYINNDDKYTDINDENIQNVIPVYIHNFSHGVIIV